MSVCEKCAKEMGWTWPDGHEATFWNGTCDYCHRKVDVCADSDWSRRSAKAHETKEGSAK